jgi:hypothetical protein
MWGTPKPASRTMVTSARGLTVVATSPSRTPKVESLKYFDSPSAVSPGVARPRSEYIASWSSLWAGRAPVVSNAPSCRTLTRPLVPGGRTSRKPP